jgi:HAD superfamily hydrolase (TIGR01484 family)
MMISEPRARGALQRSSERAAIVDALRASCQLEAPPKGLCKTRRMSETLPRPWRQVPPAAARAVRGVLTDIDDTLTSAGAITPDALQALADLRAAGVPVIAITGRPMGWSESFARDWPLAAIVAENGALALFRAGGRLCIEYAQTQSVRADNALRLKQVAARVLREVPGATLAQDSAGRVTDIAIDHREFAHLAPAQIAQVLRVMRSEGMRASVSSIHINGWFGDHDKLSGARWIVRRLLGIDIDAELSRWVYVGDSTNDQLMFGHFARSVGVANLLHFKHELRVWPAWLTEGERGSGFAEVARSLLAARA